MNDLFLENVVVNYSNEIMPPFDSIIDIIGFNSLCELVEKFGGSAIYIPTKKRLFSNCIAKQIQNEFDGGNYRELAIKYNFCERTIRNITRKKYWLAEKFIVKWARFVRLLFWREIIMKSTGIVRRIDELGRIVIPIELRRVLDISEHDRIEILTDENRIILQKYADRDIFSGSQDNLIDYCGKKVSKESIIEMAKLIGLKINE